MTRTGTDRRWSAHGIAAALLMLMAVLLMLPAASGPAVAQVNPTTEAVKEEQLMQALDRVTGRVSIPDQKAATLIQVEGQEWRAYHERTLAWIGGIAILGTLAVLAAFYIVRGRIPIEGGLSGRTIVRFRWFERFVHWLTASCFVILALSGLNVAFGKSLLLPLIGPEAFSSFSMAAKYAHNFLSFPFTLGLVLMFFIWALRNIPGRVDIAWFLQGGGIVGNTHPPAGKFNGGQKVLFWLVILVGGAIAASGYILLFPFYGTTIAQMQTAQVIHGLLAVLLIAVILGHIYIGTLGMEGAFGAMGSGQVDLNWARQHHSLWVAEVEHQAAAEGRRGVPPSAVPAE